MADSHGDAEIIHSALKLFQDQNCSRIYHLGDICDSLRPETADACIRPLQSANVEAIRGNNDQSILANQKGRPEAVISGDSLAFLERLPLKTSYHNADFVHSRPFTEELGLSSMIGSIGTTDASRYFSLSQRSILFRAHSHRPELISCQHGRSMRRPLVTDETLDSSFFWPCIITCGALTSGYCMIWEPASGAVTCLRLALT